jgi:hypothetical protein
MTTGSRKWARALRALRSAGESNEGFMAGRRKVGRAGGARERAGP